LCATDTLRVRRAQRRRRLAKVSSNTQATAPSTVALAQKIVAPAGILDKNGSH